MKDLDAGDVVLLTTAGAALIACLFAMIRYFAVSLINGFKDGMNELKKSLLVLSKDFNELKVATTGLDKSISVMTERITNYDDKLSYHREMIDNNKLEIHKINGKLHLMDNTIVKIATQNKGS